MTPPYAKSSPPWPPSPPEKGCLPQRHVSIPIVNHAAPASSQRLARVTAVTRKLPRHKTRKVYYVVVAVEQRRSELDLSYGKRNHDVWRNGPTNAQDIPRGSCRGGPFWRAG